MPVEHEFAALIKGTVPMTCWLKQATFRLQVRCTNHQATAAHFF